jgi:hypothetical protein
LPVEQTRQKRVSYHAQEQTDYRPNETATYPRFGNSDDVVGGKSKEKRAPQPKQKPTKTEAISVEKARITRLNSLRKQREAQKK